MERCPPPRRRSLRRRGGDVGDAATGGARSLEPLLVTSPYTPHTYAYTCTCTAAGGARLADPAQRPFRPRRRRTAQLWRAALVPRLARPPRLQRLPHRAPHQRHGTPRAASNHMRQRLPPYANEPATVCERACNHMSTRLQPYVHEPATMSNGARDRVQARRVQPGDLERLARRRCVGALSLPALLAPRPTPPLPPPATAATAADANANASNIASSAASAATGPEVVVLADSGSDEAGATAPMITCVSPTPPALDALRSPPRALPPAKRSRGAGAAGAGAAGAGAAGGAPPPQNTLWHFLNQRSAASLPPSAGQ